MPGETGGTRNATGRTPAYVTCDTVGVSAGRAAVCVMCDTVRRPTGGATAPAARTGARDATREGTWAGARDAVACGATRTRGARPIVVRNVTSRAVGPRRSAPSLA